MKKVLSRILKKAGYKLVRHKTDEQEWKKIYLKYKDFTMIRENMYVDSLRIAKRFASVPGCMVECGVWRGGMIAGLAEVVPDRNVYLFDSFEGLPPAKEIDGASAIQWQADKDGAMYLDNCAAEISFAERAMKMAGSDAKLYKGWFNETLPKINFEEPIAILRMDGDWYESTMDCLVNLYPKVATGGVIIIDDYYTWDGCSKAVHDYLSKNSHPSRIFRSVGGTAYIVKRD